MTMFRTFIITGICLTRINKNMPANAKCALAGFLIYGFYESAFVI